MGPSILMQWSISPTPANLTDILITRLLEHYSLGQPSRTSIHFRTYRAADQGSSASRTRLLTAIVHSQPAPLTPRDAQGVPRDDTTYLFLEDRSSTLVDDKPTEEPPPPPPPPPPQTTTSDPTANTNGDNDLEIDGFEIIDLPPDTPATPATAATPAALDQPVHLVPATPKATLHPLSKGKRGTYRILAVRPSSSVLPFLQNLLSPFVVGLTKSARAQASTTAQAAAPTPLAGTPFLVTSLTFPPLAPPNPQIILTVHNLSSAAATTIFVEGELVGDHDPDFARNVLVECLGATVPDGLGGSKVFHEWQGAEPGSWEGTERTKRMTMLLARCLREASYI